MWLIIHKVAIYFHNCCMEFLFKKYENVFLAIQKYFENYCFIQKEIGHLN